MSLTSVFGQKAHTFWVLTLEKIAVLAFDIVSALLPTPTKLNTSKYNTHLLIDWRDEFLANELCWTRKKAIEGLFNYAIFKYESSLFYSDRGDFLAQKIKDSDWVLVPGRVPTLWWKTKADTKALKKKMISDFVKQGQFNKALCLVE